MASVHSADMGVTITGNIVIRHGIPAHGIGAIALDYDQLTIVSTGANSYDVSSVMNTSDHKMFAGLIHRLNSENKLGQKRTGPEKGDDPTPPTGGTPGAARQTWYEHIKAMSKAA